VAQTGGERVNVGTKQKKGLGGSLTSPSEVGKGGKELHLRGIRHQIGGEFSQLKGKKIKGGMSVSLLS